MSRSVGRPRKYQNILEALEDDSFYSPAVIVRFAKENNLLQDHGSETDDEQDVMRRLRIALIRLSHLHHFPEQGDGQIRIKGQAPVRAWFGWRWKGQKEPAQKDRD